MLERLPVRSLHGHTLKNGITQGSLWMMEGVCTWANLNPWSESIKRMYHCSPGVAGVPNPGAIDAAWPKPPKPCKGPAWEVLCPNPVGVPKPPKGDGADADALALCPNTLEPGALAPVLWPKPPNAEGAAGTLFGWPKAGNGDAGDKVAGAPPNGVLGAPDDGTAGAMLKEVAPALPGAGAELRLKESPLPKGEVAGAGAADACCPRPPNAPNPAQQAAHLKHDQNCRWWCAALPSDTESLAHRG